MRVRTYRYWNDLLDEDLFGDDDASFAAPRRRRDEDALEKRIDSRLQRRRSPRTREFDDAQGR